MPYLPKEGAGLDSEEGSKGWASGTGLGSSAPSTAVSWALAHDDREVWRDRDQDTVTVRHQHCACSSSSGLCWSCFRVQRSSFLSEVQEKGLCSLAERWNNFPFFINCNWFSSTTIGISLSVCVSLLSSLSSPYSFGLRERHCVLLLCFVSPLIITLIECSNLHR